MTALQKRVLGFNEPLLKAFDCMVRGINIRLSKEERGSFEYEGQWWFITSIDSDCLVTIQNSNHYIVEGIRLSSIVFS